MKQTYRARFKIEDLEPHPDNPKLHDDVTPIVESIDTNGFFGAVLVQESRSRIIAGHGTVKAAATQGMTAVPVILLDVDDDQAKRILLADNRTAELSPTDDQLLATLLESLDDLTGTGFDDKDLARLAAQVERGSTAGGSVGGDDRPHTAPARAAVGDAWMIGPHRVVCGDSCDPAVVELAVDGVPADMLWTDPPYGVDYASIGRAIPHDAIQNDTGDIAEFLRQAFPPSFTHLQPGAPIYVCGPSGPPGVDFGIVLRELGALRQILTWDKQQLVMGRSDYHYSHELIFYGYTPAPTGSGRRGRGTRTGNWYGPNNENTILRYPRPHISDEHPTMKPVDLIAHCIRNSSAPDNTILDPFAGSGSTLIACHNTSRHARLIELDPLYVDVILQRAANHTGHTPTQQ